MEERGTRKQVVNIRMVIEVCKGQNIPLYPCFIDYTKTFNCVSHAQLLLMMEKIGFPHHTVCLISNFDRDLESAVQTSVGLTEWFPIGSGLRQCSILSLFLLFNMYSKEIIWDGFERN